MARDQINSFYKRATSMRGTLNRNRKVRDKNWVESAKLAERLADL